MKTLQFKSTFVRTCCLAMMVFALMFGTSLSAHAQSAADLQSDFQSSLSKLPSRSNTNKLTPKSRKLVNDTRALYQEGLGFQSMSESEQNDYLSRLNANHNTLAAAAAEKSCVQTCVDEREQCILDRCGPGTSFPCFCCVPCNLIFDLCLFDCLVDIEIGISVGKVAK